MSFVTSSAAAAPVVRVPRLTVVTSGFAQESGAVLPKIGYAVRLFNNNAVAAVNVSVLVRYVDASGLILDSNTTYLSVVPAGRQIWVAATDLLSSGDRVARIEVVAKADRGVRAAFRLPGVSNLNITTDVLDDLVASGEVTNTLRRTLMSYADIAVVLLGPGGGVVGAGTAYLPSNLPPGRRARFETTDIVSNVPIGQIMSMEVSVENQGTDLQPITR